MAGLSAGSIVVCVLAMAGMVFLIWVFCHLILQGDRSNRPKRLRIVVIRSTNEAAGRQWIVPVCRILVREHGPSSGDGAVRDPDSSLFPKSSHVVERVPL